MSVRFSLLKNAALAFAIVALPACGAEKPVEPSDADITAAREAAAALGGTLKARLLAAIAEGGPISAITVCSEEAPEISLAVSTDKAVSVGRTALRVRNPDNAPDEWERRQLEKFAAAIEDGVDPASIEYAEVVTSGETKTFRWMKPIMMDGPCQLCHGEEIADDVRAAILAFYPEDAATGFKFGEMRGAFTVEKPISDTRS